MKDERASAIKFVMTNITIITVVSVGAIILFGWWLQENFGPIATISIIGGLFAAGFMTLGILLNQRNTRHTMELLVSHHESIADARRADAGVERERVRLEREQYGAQAKIAVIDAQRVDRLARQIADARVGAERERWQLQIEDRTPQPQAQPAAQWVTVGDDDTYRHYQ
jgi:hypothetical protein